MLLKNEGLILAELLLSLSCLLMMGLFFIPLLIDLREHSLGIQIEKQAQQLLFEELQSSIVNPLGAQNHTPIINGIAYKIFWQETKSGQKEVCVNVEGNHYYQEKSICHLKE